MYYEESVIEGVLHIRTTPDGEWRKLSAEEITLKYMVKRESGNTIKLNPGDFIDCGNSIFWICRCKDRPFNFLRSSPCAWCGMERPIPNA